MAKTKLDAKDEYKKGDAKEFLNLTDDESEIVDEMIDNNDLEISPDFDESEIDDNDEDPFVDEERPSIEQIASAKTKYKIDGLSPENEKQALEMLDNGVPISDVIEYFGIARSDITRINLKK